MHIFKIFKGKNNILKKGLTSTFIKVFGALANYALSYIIAQKYGAEGNGVFALFLTYTVILSTVVYFGLDVFLVKQVSILMKDSFFSDIKKLYFKIIKNYLIPISFGILLIAWFLYLYFDKFIILMVGLGLIINVFIDINSAVFRGLKEAEWYSFFTQFSKYFITVILFLLPILEGNQDEIILIYLLSLLLNAVFSFVLLVRNFNKFSIVNKTSDRISFSLLEIFKNSKDFFFSSILIITLLWVDFIIIDIYLDEDQAGIYSVALKLSNLVTFSFLSFNVFLAPRISEIYAEGDTKKLQMILTQNFILVLPLLFVPALIILLFNKQLLGFFGSEFEDGWIALLLLTAAQFINGILGPVSLLLQMTNYQKLFQNILLLTFIIKLILAFALVNLWGINGIALASFIGISIWTIAGSFFIYKKLNVYSWFSTNDLKILYHQYIK
ncbi:oligosaccharide flippase family protein [Aequorivita nionensis]|jgi:O-antigen/teichoic acid export membrane protein|uniref:oligosaccharide flippase family protein n=1 Tax=Aequorivita nionensis TaxID=1287690 RepID=UPI003965ACC3